MSLVDEARSVRQRVAERLAELEPLVREYEELRRVASELGIPAAGSRAPREGRGRSRRSARAEARPARRRQAGAQAGESEHRTRVLEAVRASPGATISEIASTVGVAATLLYRPVRQLTAEGTLIKRGRQLFPAES